MRHFGHLSRAQTDALFERPPEPFDRASGLELLSVALGATLYMPADRPALTADLAKQAGAGVTSMVVCLEDSIADERLADAEQNLVAALTELHAGDPAELPLLFVRVRAVRQVAELVARLGPRVRAARRFRAAQVHRRRRRPSTCTRWTRPTGWPASPSWPCRCSSPGRCSTPRPGSRSWPGCTRCCSATGGGSWPSGWAPPTCARSTGCAVRRTCRSTTSRSISGLIADVVNVLGRADGTGFTVTGPVWEYFGGAERIFRTQLRESPFAEHNAPELRGQLVSRAIDGLIREVQLDRANGLEGKTAIHPSHVAVINALSVVSFEEHRDATDVLHAGRASGVLASGHRNKMNEIRPHTAWARRTHAAGQGVRGGRRDALVRRPARGEPVPVTVADEDHGARWSSGSACASTATRPRCSGWRCGATRGGPSCWSPGCWASTCRPIRGWSGRPGCCSAGWWPTCWPAVRARQLPVGLLHAAVAGDRDAAAGCTASPPTPSSRFRGTRWCSGSPRPRPRSGTAWPRALRWRRLPALDPAAAPGCRPRAGSPRTTRTPPSTCWCRPTRCCCAAAGRWCWSTTS